MQLRAQRHKILLTLQWDKAASCDRRDVPTEVIAMTLEELDYDRFSDDGSNFPKDRDHDPPLGNPRRACVGLVQ